MVEGWIDKEALKRKERSTLSLPSGTPKRKRFGGMVRMERPALQFVGAKKLYPKP